MIPASEALVDYVELMRTLPDGPGKTQRIEWWREHAPTVEAQAFVLGFLTTLAADIAMRVTCGCAMHQGKPLEVSEDTGRADATIRRLINASRFGDRPLVVSLITLVLDAYQGKHGTDGKTFAVDVRDRLERIVINGQKTLGWSTW
ncbi:MULTISPECIES: hypothetical protein [unclassified Aeromicrobium]|uniref:hypothetical protein n=1 Tax=unclassified Aeromicrobium TaxID=2633570 RepID=UPI002889ACDF|nr:MULTISPECIES: hypothetical protein [unclassified Aeromicrobium]